jgi:hypothetical protein
MSGWAPPPATVEQQPTAEELGRRLRQAALGCTVHGHGPLNALVVIAEAHQARRIDGAVVCHGVWAECIQRMEQLDPESVEYRREQKVALIVDVFATGLERL